MSGYKGTAHFPLRISQVPLQQAVQLVVGPGPGQASVQISFWRRQQRLSDWQVPVVLVSGFVQGDPTGRGLHLPLSHFLLRLSLTWQSPLWHFLQGPQSFLHLPEFFAAHASSRSERPTVARAPARSPPSVRRRLAELTKVFVRASNRELSMVFVLSGCRCRRVGSMRISAFSTQSGAQRLLRLAGEVRVVNRSLERLQSRDHGRWVTAA